MPRERVQVDSGIPDRSLQPRATPVVPMVTPTAGVAEEQLAQGLSKLSPALAQLSDVLTQKQNQSDYAAGQQKARDLAESGKSFADAVKAGRLTPDQSPWFMAGMKEQFGRVAADRWESDLEAAVNTDDNLRSSTNLADFDTFAQQHMQQWMQQNLGSTAQDEFFQKGFGARADAYMADQRMQFAQQVAHRVVSQSNEAQHSEQMGSILYEYGKGTSPDQIAASIKQANDALIAQGRNGHQVNLTTVQAVVDAARRLNDPGVLDLLDKIGGGTEGSKLSTTTYGAKAVEDARGDISTSLSQRWNMEWAMQQRNKQAALDGVYSDFVNASVQHPVDTAPYLQRLAALGEGDKAQTFLGMADAMRDRTYQDDPATVANLFRRIHFQNPGEQPTTVEEASIALAHKRVTAQTYRNIVSDITETQTAGSDPLQTDNFFKRGAKELRQLFVDEFGINSQLTRVRANAANDQFVMDYLTWRHGEGKDAKDTAAAQWLSDEKNTLFARFADKSQVQESDQPGVSGGPTLPDPSKQPIAMPSDIERLAQEWQDLTSGRSGRLSERSKFILKQGHIKLDAASIAQFIQSQRNLYHVFSHADSSDVQ